MSKVAAKPSLFCTFIEEQLKRAHQLYNETEKELNHIKNSISEKENIQVKETYSQTNFEVNYELLEAKNALSRELKIKDSLKQLVKRLWECIEMLGLNEKTDIAMKPIIIDAMKNCVKVVESHLSIPKNEAQSSTGRPIRTDEQSFTKIHHETISNAKNNYQGVIPKVSKTLKGDEHIPIEQSYQYRYDLQNTIGDGSEFQKRIHREARPLQPKGDRKEHSSMQGKVMKVFKDVMDNYNRTTPLNQTLYDKHYHSHQLSNTSSGLSKDGRQVRADYSRLVRVNKKEYDDYSTDVHKKNVSSQTPSKYDVTNKQVSASSSHKIYKKKVCAVQNVAASSSVDDCSSDVPSPIHQHSIDESIKSSTRKSLSESVSASGSAGDISSNVASAVDDQSRHESLKSSEYMSLPKANLVGISLPEKESISENSKFRRRRQVYSDHISDPSMKSEPAFPIDSELALKSSNLSSKMSASIKDNPHAEPHSNRNLESKNMRPTAIQKTSTKSSNHKSSSSGSSHNTLKEKK
ncbi:uncharacterized protein CEXT_327351 [Caerostris extrusa]|uniref:Uncharacterized protein n=1 Tax=Caerostris extrusa TaxID=172846 RepID=A0AAV4TUJ7_CAEEX|nr:uncharacterized protein CEXT_327351 [Caerostris extrusa]